MYPNFFSNLIVSTFVQVLIIYLTMKGIVHYSLATTLVRRDGSTNQIGSSISGSNLHFRLAAVRFSSAGMDDSSSTTIAKRNKNLLDDSKSVL